MNYKQDNIQQNALPRMAEGIRKAAKIVASTMGPKGKNVEIESKLYPFHIVTNDGATILKAIELADPVERIGLSHLKEAADRSNNNSGDGSSTTTVLLDSMLEGGIQSGDTSLDLKHSLDDCLPLIEKEIAAHTRPITVADIPAVAEIAGESRELAQVLGQIYQSIGEDGIIHLEGSETYETSFSLIEGVRFVDTGYLSPYMASDENAEKQGKKATKAIYHKPAILVTKNKIQNIQEIDKILQACIARKDTTLVIFTDDMDSSVARLLIELQKNPERTINILIIKAPTLWKSYVFEDFAAVTGSTIIEDSSGTSLKKMQLGWLGTCDTLVVDKEETTVIGIKDIQGHIEQLKLEGSNDSKLRLSWLQTKTAVLKIGARSETELSYLMLKAEDAVHSSRLALKEGIVAGGGVCLAKVSKVMPDTIGGRILKKALLMPIRQIMHNAGKPVVSDEYIYAFAEENKGYDAKGDRIVDMFEAGIVDSAIIVRNAVRNALGIASTLLTTDSVITIPPPSAEEMMNKAIMQPVPFR